MADGNRAGLKWSKGSQRFPFSIQNTFVISLFIISVMATQIKAKQIKSKEVLLFLTSEMFSLVFLLRMTRKNSFLREPGVLMEHAAWRNLLLLLLLPFQDTLFYTTAMCTLTMYIHSPVTLPGILVHLGFYLFNILKSCRYGSRAYQTSELFIF